MKLSELDLNLVAEKNEVEELYSQINDTQTPYPRNSSIVSLFEENVDQHPDKVAVTLEDQSVSYAELDKKANRVAHWLRVNDLKEEDIVGIYLSRSIDLIVSILGILKAGGAYLPLNIEYPHERCKYMINQSKARFLIGEKSYIKSINNLQWECSTLTTMMCIDSLNVYTEKENRNELMKDLWEYIQDNADDEISKGGWMSSYTGERMSDAEMQEYGENVLKKLEPYLTRDTRVLEIGCSSGLTMYRLAPKVNTYYGTDISQSIIDWNAKKCEEEGISNIKLQCVAAEDLHLIDEKDFDIIIFNSVIQVLSGFNSLRELINKSVTKLKDQGLLFFGDVMDLDLKNDLLISLNNFKKENTHSSTKLNFNDELFVPRAFFDDQISEVEEVINVSHSNKIHTIKNELTDFRYDTIISIDKSNSKSVNISKNKILCDIRDLDKCSEQRLSISINPEQLSNIMFTSGSTGQPKGVMIQHRSNIRTVVNSFLGVREDDIWLQTAEVSFDPSCQEIFGALLNGVPLCLIPKHILIDPDQCLKYFKQHNITILQLVTALFHHLADVKPQIFSKVRKLVVGGDVLSKRIVDKVKRINKNIEVVNAYGPTENCIISTVFTTDGDSDKIPIGKPISNSGVYIMDEQKNLLPIGMAGELHVFGDGLARGYINDDKLTNERFVANSIAGEGRMYKTGDLARLRPDGNIEFLGRLDNQVKINGNRVELQEIEQVLKNVIDLDEVLVMLQEWEGNEYVCAYIKTESQFKEEDVKQELFKLVPDHMIPRFFIKINNFPLTTNGKIDKKSLPIPDFKVANEQDVVLPGNIAESKISDIFKRILKIDKLSIHHNFFKIGGHSLLATQVISYINKEFEVALELKTFFSQPTVCQLAKTISGLKKEIKDVIPNLQKAEFYQTSRSQRRLWILEHFEEEKSAYNISDAFNLTGDIDLQALESSIKVIINRHEILRTVFTVDNNDDPVQRILGIDELNFKIGYHDLAGVAQQEDTVRSLCSQLAGTHFDLEKGPLLNITLFKLDDQKFVVLFVIHHIIADGWSIQILMNEILQTYNAVINNEQICLPELRIQYKDYAAWNNSKLDSDNLIRHEEYWLEQFKDGAEDLILDVDHEMVVRTTEARRKLFELPKDQCDKIDELSKESETTLFMYALSIINVLLYSRTRTPNITVGTPLAGRNHQDTENLIGLFLNVLPLRNKIDENYTFSELIKKVKINTINAFDHQIYPFDMLVDKLKLQRSSSRFPLFNVGFTWQNIKSNDSNEIEGVDVSPFEYDFQHVKTDLWFHGWENEGVLNFSLTYNKDLFEQDTVDRYIEDFKSIFEQFSTSPNMKINEAINKLDSDRQAKKRSRSLSAKKNKFRKFQEIEVKPISFSKEELVNISNMNSSTEYPVVIKPNIDGLVLPKWVSDNNTLLKEKLHQTGAILFRGFNLGDKTDFQKVLDALEGQPMNYADQSSPRTLVADKVYTSTDYPSDQVINMHNELSYSHDWPLIISFYCDIPPSKQGETPIADTRKVLEALSEETKNKFKKHGILYMRNLVNGLGLSWQQVYQTSDRLVVEAHCKKNHIDYKWISDDHLRISWKRPAVQKNPMTNEYSWFNHGFFFNAANLDQAIHDVITDENLLPFNTYFGNGEKINTQVFNELREAYEHCKIKFSWEKGDLLVLDNMSMAHGREKYEGERKILVGMNKPFSSISF